MLPEMRAPNDTAETPERELFGTRIGFVLAAAGSAIGLGNMWRTIAAMNTLPTET